MCWDTFIRKRNFESVKFLKNGVQQNDLCRQERNWNPGAYYKTIHNRLNVFMQWHTYIHTCTHHVACIQSSILTKIHAYMHTYTATYLCTYMHTYITLNQFFLSNQMLCEDCGCTTHTLWLRHYKCLLCRSTCTIVYVGLLKTKTYK